MRYQSLKKIPVVLLVCLNLILIEMSYAEEEKGQALKGHKGAITQVDLLSAFKKGEVVDGYAINGDDLIEIIKTTDFAIKIKNSIIKGGLNFENLPLGLGPSQEQDLPKFRSEDQKVKFLKKHRDKRWINNQLNIQDSEIKTFARQSTVGIFHSSIYTPSTYFMKNVFFGRTEFSGGASFATATFAGLAFFSSATFSSNASFMSTTFDGQADFQAANFKVQGGFGWANFLGKANFSSASFSDVASFKSATFRRNTYFSAAKFHSSVDFTRAAFTSKAMRGGAVFRSTIFGGRAYFESAAFSGETDFGKAAFNREANFKSTTYRDNVLFNSSTFNDEVNFGSATFHANIVFTSCTFKGDADFGSSTVGGHAYFGEAVFNSLANFNNTRFRMRAKFISATFNGSAYFRSAAFRRSADFSMANFRDSANFRFVTFSSEPIKDGALFKSTTFGGPAYFNSSAFGFDADFSAANFQKAVSFKNAVFFRQLSIGTTQFETYGDFREAEIRRLDYYAGIPIALKSNIDFRSARITEAHFQNVIYENDVDFSDVEFGADPLKFRDFDKFSSSKALSSNDGTSATVFRFITFKANVDFIRTQFNGDTAFERVKFKGDTNFRDAVFKTNSKNGPKFSFTYFDFNNLNLKWNQFPFEKLVKSSADKIKSFIDRKQDSIQKDDIAFPKEDEKRHPSPTDQLAIISDLLQNLEAHFRFRNQLDDANQAYFHTKRLKLAVARKNNQTSFWNRTGSELEWIFWGLACGYGTKSLWIAGWFLLFHLIFTFLYFAKGDLSPLPAKEYADLKGSHIFDFPNNLYVLNTPCIELPYDGWRKLYQAHRFSAVVLLKFGKKDTILSDRSGLFSCRNFILIEWGLGFYLWFCLVITLSNTFPLIHRLLEGVL